MAQLEEVMVWLKISKENLSLAEGGLLASQSNMRIDLSFLVYPFEPYFFGFALTATYLFLDLQQKVVKRT